MHFQSIKKIVCSFPCGKYPVCISNTEIRTRATFEATKVPGKFGQTPLKLEVSVNIKRILDPH